MAKISINDIKSGYASTAALNTAFTALETALDNTLSRDGTGPNQMNADLDMNGHYLLNSGNAIQVTGFAWEGPWVTSRAYQVGDITENNGTAYMCIVAHTSSTFATDLAAAKWQTFATASLPTQTGNAKKFLQTDGSTLSWKTPDASEITFLQAGTGALNRTAQVKLRELAVSVKDFGAVGDGAADDTAALKAAIDAVSAAGGGVVRIPRGTYKHTGLTLPSNITLQGEGYRVTVLDYTTATGNGITLASGARYVSILDLGLHSSGASTGWAISGTAGVIGEFTINRYFITGFLNGIDIWQAINSNIGIGRMQGRGRTVAGGVGLRLGNSSTEISTTVTVGQTYFQDYETNTHNVFCPGLLCIGTVWETSKTAFKTAQHTYLFNCYWEANDTYDIDAAGDGVVVFGDYGLNMAKVLLDGTATARSLFHRRGGSYHTKERFLFGPNGDFGGALRATLADGTGTSLRISVANPVKTGTGDDVHWESLSPDGRQYWWSKTLRFMEFDGTNFKVDAPFILGGGTALTKHLSATASLDFAAIAANTTAELNITVTGAAAGDTVIVSPSGAPEAGLGWQGFAGTDLVTVRLSNVTTAAIDPAARTWRVDVWKH